VIKTGKDAMSAENERHPEKKNQITAVRYAGM